MLSSICTQVSVVDGGLGRLELLLSHSPASRFMLLPFCFLFLAACKSFSFAALVHWKLT
jgi:hypothetical protein